MRSNNSRQGERVKEIPAKEYLEQKVFPTLLPALEELLRWVQTHQNERPVSCLRTVTEK